MNKKKILRRAADVVQIALGLMLFSIAIFLIGAIHYVAFFKYGVDHFDRVYYGVISAICDLGITLFILKLLSDDI